MYVFFFFNNYKNKHHIKYPDMPSAIKPGPHEPGILIPTPPPTYTDLLSSSDDAVDNVSGTYQHSIETCQPKLLSQPELNDLARDFSLSKISS